MAAPSYQQIRDKQKKLRKQVRDTVKGKRKKKLLNRIGEDCPSKEKADDRRQKMEALEKIEQELKPQANAEAAPDNQGLRGGGSNGGRLEITSQDQPEGSDEPPPMTPQQASKAAKYCEALLHRLEDFGFLEESGERFRDHHELCNMAESDRSGFDQYVDHLKSVVQQYCPQPRDEQIRRFRNEVARSLCTIGKMMVLGLGEQTATYLKDLVCEEGKPEKERITEIKRLFTENTLRDFLTGISRIVPPRPKKSVRPVPSVGVITTVTIPDRKMYEEGPRDLNDIPEDRINKLVGGLEAVSEEDIDNFVNNL